MMSATAVNYFKTDSGRVFTWEKPESPVQSIEIATAAAPDWGRISRTLSAMQQAHFMDAEHGRDILLKLRQELAANDNPKSWTQTILDQRARQHQLER